MKATLTFLLVLFSILSVRYFFFFHQQKQYRGGEEVTLEGVLLDEPKRFGNSQRFHLKRILVTTKNNIDLHYGDRIKVFGLIEQQKTQSKGTVQDILFGRKSYLVKQATVKRLEDQNALFSFSYMVRERVSSVFNSYLSPNHAALLIGIVLGVHSDMNKDFSYALSQAGVLHVVAASGMNVSMLSAAVLSFLLLFFHRFLGLFLTSALIIFYAFLSGLEPSILRAGIMAIFGFSALAFGRQYTSYLALCLAAFLILFTDPAIIGDVGFQLSFLATLGILVYKPLFDNLFVRGSFTKRIGLLDDASTTLSAQIGSLPILAGAFSSYAAVSVMVNIVVLWTIPYLMAFGGLAALASLIFSPLAVPFLYLSIPFLLFFEKTVLFFSERFEALTIPEMPTLIWIGYYCVVLAVALCMQNKISNLKDQRSRSGQNGKA